jgi:hypothetical protein
MSIPKQFFTYWEGDQLSKLHYYTIFSLLKYNPDTPITIYTSTPSSSTVAQWNTGEHAVRIAQTVPLESLRAINPERVEIVPIDFEREYSINSAISVVFKADFIRIAKLYEHGGMWFDMDILFVKPVPNALFISDVDLYYYSYLDTIPTGLLFASPNTPFMKELFIQALARTFSLCPGALHSYQTLGPDLWNDYFKHHQASYTKPLQCLETSDVYPYDCDKIRQIYAKESQIPENTFGIHWYNGHHLSKEFINSLDIDRLNPERSLMERMLYHIINT